MELSKATWNKYIKKLEAVDAAAARRMQTWIDLNGLDRVDAVIAYAYRLATTFGEASAELACEMYDAIALLEGAAVPTAEPAATATYGETAAAVRGTLDTAPSTVPATVSRLVKQAGADTTLQNAARDRAQFAWIPSGDTCAFCITLASRGWQYVSKNSMKNGHAEHIHANCNCEYAIRFSDDTTYEGYAPARYRRIYDQAEGNTPKDKINYMRRQFYAENKSIVGADSSKAEEFIPFSLREMDFKPAATIAEAETYAKDHFVSGGFNLTGQNVSYKNIDVDVANKINNRLGEIYDTFDIPKLSSLESYGKANRRAWSGNAEAPMFTTNFGNIGLNNTLVKSQKLIDKYNKQGADAFQYVIDNINTLKGDSRKLAEAYKAAGKSLVGDTIEDFITHEIGHHISYIPEINKSLARIQSSTDWKSIAAKLSGYSNHSFGEYFAESFNAFCRGEQDILQPELVEIFESLRRK